VHNERWEVGERPSLDVRVPTGTIEICVGDAGIVQLSVDSGDVAEFEIFKAGERISVRHPSRWRMRDRSCRVVATVPSGTDIDISSTSAEVRLSGRLGIVRVRTTSGDVHIGDALRLDVTTASGDVSCGDIGGEASVTSLSGDCTITSVASNLQATLTSGDLRVDECCGDVHAGSTSGDVRVGRCGGSDIEMTSISGDVRVALPSGIRVDAEIATLSGRATLPEAVEGAALLDRRRVRLRLKSVSGDIRVERVG
jgi:hypothetical protein